MDGTVGTIPPEELCASAGGVEAVWLAAADAVTAAAGDAASWTTITLREGCRFGPCAVAEDGAGYVQRMQGAFSLWYIRHELSWTLPVAGGRAAAVVERLRELDGRGGIVALLRLASGETVLAGWSADFGAGRPLRLVAAEADSSTRQAEDPVVRVTLRANDVACSRPFTGRDDDLL